MSCQSHNSGRPHKCTPGRNKDDDDDDFDDDNNADNDDDLHLLVLDSPLEESFAGLTGEEAVVVAGHLQQHLIGRNSYQKWKWSRESESEVDGSESENLNGWWQEEALVVAWHLKAQINKRFNEKWKGTWGNWKWVGK